MRNDGLVVLIQPHQTKRVHVAITSATNREPVAALINPEFQPLINAANAAIRTVMDERLFARAATSHHRFKVWLANPTAMDDYLRQGVRPPRFPKGGRQRFQVLWKKRSAGARIEATEFMTVISLRPTAGNP